MERVIILGHDDLDGIAASAVANHFYSQKGYICKCFPVNYNKILPFDEIQEDDIVVIVDFTPPLEADFQRILAKTKRLIWIDHHINNINQHKFYNMSLEGLRVDTTPSGAGAAWEYFYPDTEIPDAITYTSDFDTWEFKYGAITKAWEAGTASLDINPQSPIWNTLFDKFKLVRDKATQEIIERGKVVLEYRKQFYNKYAENCAFECEFEGYKTIACNIGFVGSLVFERIDVSQYDLMSIFVSNGENITVSIYTTDKGYDINCAEICNKYGGGGHPGSGGFKCDTLPYNNIKRI